MIGELPDSFWKPVAVKRFETDSQVWVLSELTGNKDEMYRITVRQNNMSGKRDQIRIHVNDDKSKENYEAVEAYMSADYSFSDRKLFDAISKVFPKFEHIRNQGRKRFPDWEGWEVINPGWRVLRSKNIGYLTFGKPLPGKNALFGHGILLASSGGPRSLLRKCSEQHPNGNLLTVGRYTYKNNSDPIQSLVFSSEHENGLGKGSFIVVERLDLPE